MKRTVKAAAADAYAAQHDRAIELLDEIREALQDLPAPDSKEFDAAVIHWGHVGDLQHINSELRAILSFVLQTEVLK